MEFQGSFFQYGIEFFKEVFCEGGKLPGIAGRSSAPSVEIGAQQVSNLTVKVRLGSGCEGIVPCRGAQGLGLTPARHSRAPVFPLCPPAR